MITNRMSLLLPFRKLVCCRANSRGFLSRSKYSSLNTPRIIQEFSPAKLRNLAIIAHIDHGKTTLVDCLLRQSGALSSDSKEIRVMDHNQLEKERGITILSKCTSILYKDYKINLVDTPGHADFGGEVERVLSMVEGVVLVVDVCEGPMPQTKFVLSKALKRNLKPIVVFNKVDRGLNRLNFVENELFDLFAGLNATDEQMNYPCLFSSAKDGWCVKDYNKDEKKDMKSLLDEIINYIPHPQEVLVADKFKMLVTQIDNDQYLGKCLLGKIASGKAKIGDVIHSLNTSSQVVETNKISKIYIQLGMVKTPIKVAYAGDIVSINGIQNAGVNDTLSDPENLTNIAYVPIDPPTISMTFAPNDSPLAGKEGKLLTFNAIKTRIIKEAETNVSLRVNICQNEAIEVKGRGELQLGILIESMRREGFELSISPPNVICKKEGETILEPIEELNIEVESEFSGIVMDKLTKRMGNVKKYEETSDGKTKIIIEIPIRALIGYQKEFKNDTRGQGILSSIFHSFQPYKGPLSQKIRKNIIYACESGKATSYAIEKLENRGKFFVSPGDDVYPGMIVGEYNKDSGSDLKVNICRAKDTGNMRASLGEDGPRQLKIQKMTLEESISYVQSDEIIEVTPKSVRLRKKELDDNKRRKAQKEQLTFG